MSDAVADLLARMTLAEKVAQLAGLWLRFDPDAGEVAPFPGVFADATRGQSLDALLAHGIGQITRLYGSGPVDAAHGVRLANDLQRRLRERTRLGIPAVIHDECLTGFLALGATEFPAPLAWGASFDPALIEQVGDAIRRQMRACGVHHGLAPVLDVVRDPRWGRCEECIGEDPYLVGVVGSAYVRGLQGRDLREGVVATLKHFAAYSASEGGRNLAPVHVGPRELHDCFLVPFEMAIRLAGAASVMNAYQENDGVPAAASRELLTDVLRDQLGFTGVVVADYGSISFLHALHHVSDGPSTSAALALEAGIDVELPNPQCYARPLVDAVEAGVVDEGLVDRSVRRVLRQKEALGLLDDPFVAEPDHLDLDPPDARALARTVAERSIVLLENDGVLPLGRGVERLALVGPIVRRARALLGNYAFDNHTAPHVRDAPPGPHVVTVEEGVCALAAAHGMTVVVEDGCDVTGSDRSGFAAATAAARAGDVTIVVVGDQAGHFGTGTVGEGTDVETLDLPGVQGALVDEILATGVPVVVVVVAGRPYALDAIGARAAALVESFFPGEEGGAAIAGLLFGEVSPSGRLPVSHAASAGQLPIAYLMKPLGRRGFGRTEVVTRYPFGFGRTYTTFVYSDLETVDAVRVDGAFEVACTVRNTGDRAGAEIVQLYLSDAVASVTRPERELKGFARAELAPGEAARVRFTVPVDLLSFTGVDLVRIVEPGEIEVLIGASSADIRLRHTVRVEGEVRTVGRDRALVSEVTVERMEPVTERSEVQQAQSTNRAWSTRRVDQ